FNSARLHQKVFEERFLYHADKLGYLVWGEFGDWGISLDDAQATMITQWLEVLHRDYNHPSIIGWCGLNETHKEIGDGVQKLDDVTRGMFLAAKAMDTTRPVLDSSGYSHRVPEADVYDCHDYDQDPQALIDRHARLGQGEAFLNGDPEKPCSVPYAGQPYFVSEFGGIWWNPKAAKHEDSWGYGERPKNIEEFYTRFKGLCDALLDNPAMFGYCYTQLTDVFQEQNGVVFFDRSEKFDMARLHAIQSRTAAIEQ
ncbi:MAG: glycoside hydrolase family 2 TIM barrel-domain containing protein, partial [Planctomycetota bacterium]